MNAAAVTMVLLSLTGLILFQVGEAPISIFLICLPVSLLALAGRTDLRRKEVRWLLFFVFYVLLNFALNRGGAKVVTVCYALLFVGFFTAIYGNIGSLAVEDYMAATKVVMVLYAVNLVVTQVLVGIDLQNDFLGGVFHSSVDENSGKVRYFSFSSEPSYASFVVAVSYYAYYRLCRLSAKRPSVFYLALIIYCVYFFRSIYGILLVSLIIMIRIKDMKSAFYKGLAVSCIALALITALSFKTQSEGRLHDLTQFALTGKFDIDALNSVDSSTWMRVFPTMDYVSGAKPSDPGYLFGHGAGSSTDYFTDRFQANVYGEEGKMRLGFMPSFLYDYGFAGALIVLIFIFRVGVPRLWSFEAAAVLMMLFNANFNSQLFWYVILNIAALKYYALVKKRAGQACPRESLAPA